MDTAEIVAEIIVVVALFFIFNFLATWLWGVIAVGIFGLPSLGYWQMFGLRILLGLCIPSGYMAGGSDD